MTKVAKNPAIKAYTQMNKQIYKEARKIARMLENPDFKARPLDIGRFAVDLVLYCQIARINERMLQHAPARMAPEAGVEVGRWLTDLTTRIYNMQVDNEELVSACLKEIEEICADVNTYAAGQRES
jgi:hypothetical protein